MRTRWFLLGALAAILLLGLTACGGSESPAPAPTATSVKVSPAQNPATYVTLDVRAAYEQVSASEDAQFVDVRQSDEWAATGVPAGARLISLAQLEQRAPAELARDKPVYVLQQWHRRRVGGRGADRLGYSQVTMWMGISVLQAGLG